MVGLGRLETGEEGAVVSCHDFTNIPLLSLRLHSLSLLYIYIIIVIILLLPSFLNFPNLCSTLRYLDPYRFLVPYTRFPVLGFFFVVYVHVVIFFQ